MISRRSVLSSLACSPLLASTTAPVEVLADDAQLVGLGRRFEKLAAQIDYAIDCGSNISDEVLNELGRVEEGIETEPARSIDGLRVKARAACWALLGDFSAADRSTTDKRMAFSIVRDLIRLYDPGLEQPDAIKKLVEDIEYGASNSHRVEATGALAEAVKGDQTTREQV